MNREIKFRVWDKQCGRFVKGDLFFEQEDRGTFEPDCYHDKEGEIHCMKFTQTKLDHYHGYVIQQYTGLKDKNGKEIYEGDIVQKMITGPVEYFLGEFSIGGVTPLKDFLIIPSDENQPLNFNLDLEIIGNIFETPELLEL
jgi:uncharacterized phage protein (TIGR01671 family)